MNKCPFFGKCGGCKHDFTAPNYQEVKKGELNKNLKLTQPEIWTPAGARRRADFCFCDNKFGFFEAGSKNIIPIKACPNLIPEINDIIPALSKLPWVGSGACLITMCDNGLDVAITSNVPFFGQAFKTDAEKLPVIRISWNDKVIKETAKPIIKFGDVPVLYPTGGFLQPTKNSEDIIRDLVIENCAGAKKTADLFCGLGNFTFALGADGFDIFGTGIKRDLFKQPLTVGMLKQYDCVVMDPPRAGAMAQCQELVKSDVNRVIYVSCNPVTFMRDVKILEKGGFCTEKLIAIDQFVGSSHWELFALLSR